MLDKIMLAGVGETRCASPLHSQPQDTLSLPSAMAAATASSSPSELPAEPRPLRLPHPRGCESAWVALSSACLAECGDGQLRAGA